MGRVLAVSDQVDEALYVDRHGVRAAELILACGDLPFDYLAFLMDALRVPLVFVPGNHDPGIEDFRTREELLLSPDGMAVTIKLRRVLHSLEQQQAIDLLLDRLRKTRTNTEFLMQIAKTTPGQE